MPETTRETARAVVRKVVDELERRLARQHPGRGHRRARTAPARTRRPAPRDIDWDRTIRANLKHYQPEHRTVVPERLVGYGRAPSGGAARRRPLPSTSPARWPPRSSTPRVFGAVLASHAVAAGRAGRLRHRGRRPHRAARTTRSTCCSARQLGGGTDINRALAYCQALDHPARRARIFVLISDLYEGGIARRCSGGSRAMQAGRRPGHRAARAVRRRARRPTTTTTPRRWPRWACRPSPARPTCSPT